MEKEQVDNSLKSFALDVPGLSPAARHSLEYVSAVADMQAQGIDTPTLVSFVVPKEISDEFKRFFYETSEFMRARDLHSEWRAFLKHHGY